MASFGKTCLTTRNYRFRVITIGGNGVGKTTLIDRYVTGIFRHHGATIGASLFEKRVQWSDSETMRLELWDFGAHEFFHESTRLLYRGAKGCLMVFDVTDRSSFLNIKEWKEDVDREVALQNDSPVPCILLANKCDLSPWAVTREEIDELSKENGFIGWKETSSKENTNINESMRILIEKMMDTVKSTAVSGQRDNISL